MNDGPLRYSDRWWFRTLCLVSTLDMIQFDVLRGLGGKNPDLFNVRKDLFFQNSPKVSLNFSHDPDPKAAFVKMLRWLNQIGSNCATGIPVYKTCCPRLVGMFLFLKIPHLGRANNFNFTPSNPPNPQEHPSDHLPLLAEFEL